MSLFEISFPVLDILGTYVTYRMMRVFFNVLHTGRKIELLSYAGYYLINEALFFWGRIPAVMTGANIMMIFLLTFNYDAKIFKRLLATGVASMILTGAELMVAKATSPFAFAFLESSTYDSVIGMAIYRLLTLFAVIAASRFKNTKEDFPILRFYWFSLIFIPIASLFLIIVYFSNTVEINRAQSVGVLAVIIALNFIVLFIYNDLYRGFSAKTDEELRQKEMAAYKSQMEITQQASKDMDDIRHDVNNHMIAIREAYASGKADEAEDHIGKVLSRLRKKEYSHSNNYALDGIINAELRKIADMGIKPVVYIAIPENLDLPNYQITTIIGNLLNNAVTALRRCKGERVFSLSVVYEKENLKIIVINSYEGEIVKNGDEFVTTKTDKGRHGRGIKNIKKALSEIDGDLFIRYDGRLFKAIVVFSCRLNP